MKVSQLHCSELRKIPCSETAFKETQSFYNPSTGIELIVGECALLPACLLACSLFVADALVTLLYLSAVQDMTAKSVTVETLEGKRVIEYSYAVIALGSRRVMPAAPRRRAERFDWRQVRRHEVVRPDHRRASPEPRQDRRAHQTGDVPLEHE